MKRLWMAAVVASLGLVACKKDKAVEDKPAPVGKVGAPGETSPSSNAAAQAGKKAPEGCNSDLSQRVEVNWTMTEKCSPFTVTGDFNVSGWDLTIEPGVEVRFADNAHLYAGYNGFGKILARGTAEKPIRFVAQTRKEPGSWKGVTLYKDADGSTLENVELEHAGNDEKAALELDQAIATVKGLKVVGAKRKALSVRTDEPQKALENLDFTQASEAEDLVDMTIENAGVLANVKLPAKGVIELSGNSDQDLKIPNAGATYRLVTEWYIDGKGGSSKLVTIEPGVTIEMADTAGIWVGYHPDQPAGLKAVGTQEKPIVLKRFGDDQKQTPWRGITFYGGARPAELAWVTIENAGRKEENQAITFEGSRGLGSISHVTIKSAPGGAIWVKEAKEKFTAFSDNTIEDAGDAVISGPPRLLSGLGANNTLPPNGWIKLTEDYVRDSVTLTAQGVPYRVHSGLTVDSGEAGKTAALTLEPGVVLAFGEGQALTVGYGNLGKLVAKGTAEKPITFKAIETKWRGLEASEKGTLELENVSFEAITDDSAAMRTAAETQGFITNATFKNAAGAVRHCGDKLKITGLKGIKETKDGC